MRIALYFTIFIISFSANAGLPPWKYLPEQKNPIKIQKPFNKKHWKIQNIDYFSSEDDYGFIRKIINVMHGGLPFKFDHHKFLCYQNKSEYLYIYDSGWGPGYALVDKKNSDVPDTCEQTEVPFLLGNGLKIGMSIKDAENLLSYKLSESVTDIVYDKVVNTKYPPNKICPEWDLVTLKIVAKKDKITSVYFDDHAEPAEDCKYINPLMLGVLDENQCQNKILGVRPLFAQDEKTWDTLDSSTEFKKFGLNKIKWIVAFDGKDWGEIESLAQEYNDEEWMYPRDYRQPFYSIKKLNLITNKKNQFTGWCNSPRYRPLILITKPNYKDPDKWKPFQPVDELKNLLHPEFVKSLLRNKICTTNKGLITGKLYKSEPGNIVFLKSYKSNKNAMLVQINLNNGYGYCDSTIGKTKGNSWFFVKNSLVKYIGDDMELIDAGDYDADGVSEIIYWYSGENKDGYILFGSELDKKASFLWKYH